MNENNKVKPLMDFATIITVLGLFFYFFGFIYTSFFYHELGIKASLIDMSMNKILFTTWHIPLLLAFALIFAYCSYFFSKLYKVQVNIITTIISVIFSLGLLYLAVMLIEIKDEQKHYTYTLVFSITFAVLLVVSIKIKNVKKINIITFNYIIIGASFVASIFFYPYMGMYFAKNAIENYEEDIEINLKNEAPKIYGKFISYMNDKYFILVEDKNCLIKTSVINNDEISIVNFLVKKP